MIDEFILADERTDTQDFEVVNFPLTCHAVDNCVLNVLFLGTT